MGKSASYGSHTFQNPDLPKPVQQNINPAPALPQLAGKNLVEKTFKKAVPPSEPVRFEISGSNPEIKDAHMDDAMMEE